MASSWKLPAAIIDLSESTDWSIVVKEWQLDYIEHLEAGEESETCLCGHYPIRELCHIINTRTNENAIIGNHCITKFDKDDPAHAVFGDAPKVFRSFKTILNEPTASASKATLDYAAKKKFLQLMKQKGMKKVSE